MQQYRLKNGKNRLKHETSPLNSSFMFNLWSSDALFFRDMILKDFFKHGTIERVPCLVSS